MGVRNPKRTNTVLGSGIIISASPWIPAGEARCNALGILVCMGYEEEHATRIKLFVSPFHFRR